MVLEQQSLLLGEKHLDEEREVNVDFHKGPNVERFLHSLQNLLFELGQPSRMPFLKAVTTDASRPFRLQGYCAHGCVL